MCRPLLLFLLFAPCFCTAQFYLGPLAGYQHLFSPIEKHALNTGLQAAYSLEKVEFLLELQKSWPGGGKTNDSAFTLNSSEPTYISVDKQLNTDIFSVGLGVRVWIASLGPKDRLNLRGHLAAQFQRTKVSYDKRPDGYVLLNPDKTMTVSGPSIGAGAEYMHLFNNGRLFAELSFYSPPWGKYDGYPVSFYPLTSMSVNIGYSFLLSNSKQ